MRQGVHPSLNFGSLLGRIEPQASELEKARLHAVEVRNRLHKTFIVKRALLIGSQVRGTAVRYYSDVDVLYVFPRNEARWGQASINSNTLLNNVRAELIARFTTTAIGRDGQAVVIAFSQGNRSMDVVPAWFDGFDKMRPIYNIPDGAGGWIRTSPELHDRIFIAADKKAGGKLSRTIRLLKWWKYSRTTPIPISSFYAELVLSDLGTCIGAKGYSMCLYESLLGLQDRCGRALRDPAGISGLVPMANTSAQVQQVREAIDSALDRAERACVAEQNKDIREANYQWNLLFNGKF